jgi:hypothetical protein
LQSFTRSQRQDLCPNVCDACCIACRCWTCLELWRTLLASTWKKQQGAAFLHFHKHLLIVACANRYASLLTSRAKLFEQVQAILEKYQEQSNLLDPHLEAMMAVIMGRVREMTTAREAAAAEAQAAGAGFPYQVSHLPETSILLQFPNSSRQGQEACSALHTLTDAGRPCRFKDREYTVEFNVTCMASQGRCNSHEHKIDLAPCSSTNSATACVVTLTCNTANVLAGLPQCATAQLASSSLPAMQSERLQDYGQAAAARSVRPRASAALTTESGQM